MVEEVSEGVKDARKVGVASRVKVARQGRGWEEGGSEGKAH